MRRHSSFLIPAVLLSALVIRPSAAQNSADVHPIPLNVTVTDPLNRLVTDLPPGAFQVFEDKVRQPITSFGRADAPLSIGIVFDTSGSMGGTLARSRLSVAEFFKTTTPDDEAFLVEFSDRPQLVVPMTHNFTEIQDQLTETAPKGRTALLDGIYLALNTMEKAHNPRKVLIVISDGFDNSSRYKTTEAENLIREAGVQIYGIGIYEAGGGRGRMPEELSGPEMLKDLSEPTGGRHFVVENLGELPDVAAKIGIELRNQYIIGYSPTNQVRDGKYRKILVKVVPPPRYPALHAYWRNDYFAPTQ